MLKVSSLIKTLGGELWLVLALVAAIGIGVAALASYLPHAMTVAALDAASRSNVEVADQIKITRGYYTRNVVAKALDTGALVPSYQHTNDRHAIPLPATFVHDISELLKARDTSLALVSPFPWPHRAGRAMDNFQQKAWDAFQKDPNAIFQRQEVRDGKRVLRVAVADTMAATCVSCHNSHPESTKTDWKVGDVRAVMEVSKVVEPYLADAEVRSRMTTWSIAIPALVVASILLAGALVMARYNVQKRTADENMRFLARHDGMTGLLNRAAFISRLAEWTAQSPLPEFTLYYVDLDGFKDINDRFGHGAGDQLLISVAERFQALSPPRCLISRLGGDEFALALEKQSPASPFGERLIAALERPFKIGNQQIVISASVGTCAIGDEVATPEQLLEAADLALYRAKSLGKGRVVGYSPQMGDEIQKRRSIERRVKYAVAHQLFELYFQPLYDRRRRLSGFEALLRLRDENGAHIPPATFVPIAEDLGLISEIGEWVIQHACKIASCWPAELTVAVNLSPAQFLNTELQQKAISEVVREALRRAGLRAGRLELEITEGLLLEATKDVMAELHKLKEIGAAIVMDDFGTGYSSLSYFWKLPFDKIKIDRSFVMAVEEAGSSIRPILETIVILGRTLNMKVTAEGIETAAQAAHFTALDCDYYQVTFSPNLSPKQKSQPSSCASCTSRWLASV